MCILFYVHKLKINMSFLFWLPYELKFSYDSAIQ